MKKIIICTFGLILLYSCGAAVKTNISGEKYSPLSVDEKIYVLNSEANLPSNSKLVGDLKVGDTGFSTDCGYETIMSEAKKIAKTSGANIIKVKDFKTPGFGSSCFRIKADLYRDLEITDKSSLDHLYQNSYQRSIPENADYAVIYFYRESGPGFLLGYKVKDIDNNVIGRVRDSEKFAYKTTKFGVQQFFGELETKESVVINVQKGQEYFVRCGVKMGVVLGRPEIYLVDNMFGKKQYDAVQNVSNVNNK